MSKDFEAIRTGDGDQGQARRLGRADRQGGGRGDRADDRRAQHGGLLNHLHRDAAGQQQYAARGLQVVGIDELESASQAEGFRKQFHLVYPAVADSGTLQGQYLINGLPVHVFIGRDGVIRKIVAGEMSHADIQKNVQSIL